jgi:hypothetical protein
MDIIVGMDSINASEASTNNENVEDMQKNNIVEKTTTKVSLKEFKLNSIAENTLDLYISKLKDYYSKIGQEQEDIISKKAKVLEAVLGTDTLKID